MDAAWHGTWILFPNRSSCRRNSVFCFGSWPTTNVRVDCGDVAVAERANGRRTLADVVISFIFQGRTTAK